MMRWWAVDAAAAAGFCQGVDVLVWCWSAVMYVAVGSVWNLGCRVWWRREVGLARGH